MTKNHDAWLKENHRIGRGTCCEQHVRCRLQAWSSALHSLHDRSFSHYSDIAAVAAAFIVLALFPLLGRDYQVAVLSAGFTGLSLGRDADRDRKHDRCHQALRPVTKRLHHLAACLSLFVDLVNAIAIKAFLAL
jgi:Sodium/glutamate symporter